MRILIFLSLIVPLTLGALFTKDEKFKLNKDLCVNGGINAAVQTKDGSSYFFKGTAYWRIQCDRVKNGYPRPIFDDWGIDHPLVFTGFTFKNGTTCLIAAENYWCYVNKKRLRGYPKNVYKDFDIPISEYIVAPYAAFCHTINDEIWFFYRSVYFKHDLKNKTSSPNIRISSTFLRSDELDNDEEEGVKPDAILQFKQSLAFFNGPYYNLYVKGTNVPKKVKRPLALDFLQCKDNDQPLYTRERCCSRMRWGAPRGLLKQPPCPKVLKAFEKRMKLT